jgi:hypothetical protein
MNLSNMTDAEILQLRDRVMSGPCPNCGVPLRRGLCRTYDCPVNAAQDRTPHVNGKAVTLSPEPYFDVVFDGPPGHESGRFVEVEDESGASISVGEWVERPDGLWALRIPRGVLPWR